MKEVQQNLMLDVTKENVHVKTEEVQAIIDRMPTYWVKWVVFCISILVAVLITLSFIIQYPDTVDGEITLTAHLAPVRLVSKSNAMVH